MEQGFQQQYAIELRADGLFFVRFPSSEEDVPIGVEEILSLARGYGISKDREADVVKIFREAQGVEILVCPSEEIQTEDGIVRLGIATDGMQAQIELTPPRGYGEAVTENDVIESLKEKGVVYGLLQDEIERAVKEQGKGGAVIVAKGTPAIDGQDGKVANTFSLEEKGKPKLLEDGTVDFHSLNLIYTAEQGTVLAEVIQPIPGVAGMNIFGNEIKPKEGKQAMPPVGKNVTYDESTRLLVAGITGEVVIEKAKITVLATHTATGDIGPETGDIDFAGSVVVRGNVLSGYTVRASGSVDIHGQVVGGIVAAGSDVVIRVGIQGQGHGYVKSGGSVMAKFIENANIMAAGDVDGGEAIIQSHIDSGGIVKVLNRKGVIVGGVIRAARMVHANVIGADIGTQTDIEIGINPLFREEFKEISTILPEKEKDLEKVKKALVMLKQMEKAANGVLPEDKKNMLLNLTKTQFQLTGEIATMHKRRAELEVELENAKQGKLMARDYIYPGTRILIGKARMHVQDTIQHATLALEDWEIRIGPY